MTLYQVYEAVLTEINKVEAPVMLLEDFNYFYKKAVYQYCNLKYNNAEKDQQALDDLSFLYTNLTTEDTGPIVLDNYYHSLGCSVSLVVTKAFKNYAVGDIITLPAARYRADFDITRPFYKPSEKRVYYRVKDSVLELFLPSSNMRFSSVSIEYLKLPTIDELTEEELELGESFDLPYTEYQMLEIINLIVKSLLENATDPRVQTFTPINQTIQ